MAWLSYFNFQLNAREIKRKIVEFVLTSVAVGISKSFFSCPAKERERERGGGKGKERRNYNRFFKYSWNCNF